MSEHNYASQNQLTDVVDSIKILQDTAFRTDERVKLLLSMQSKSDENLHEMRNMMSNLVSRVAVLEARDENEIKVMTSQNRDKIHEIEKQIMTLTEKEKGHESRWRGVIDWAAKLLWLTVAAYLLYKLGLNPSPLD